MKRVFVLGSINVDYVMMSPRVPAEGETMHGSNFFINGGGKGANQAVAAAKNGAETYMVGCVGGDVMAETMLSELKGYGVCTRFVHKKTKESTGAAQIVVVNGNNRIILCAGANDAVGAAEAEEALAFAGAGDVFVVQNEIPEKTVFYGLKRAREKGMYTIYNPAPARRLAENELADCRAVVVNEIEILQITGESTIAEAVKKLRGWNVEDVIVTLGGAGCLLAAGDALLHFPALRVKAVDTTAAGDTFIGVFACRMAATENVRDAIARAVVASGMAVTRRGAQVSIPTGGEVSAFAAANAIEMKSRELSARDLSLLEGSL